MSLALNALLNLLPGSCKPGGALLIWLFHIDPPRGEEAPDGVIGGVEVGGIRTEEEPRERGLSDPMSREAATGENDLGEGSAEPVDAYNGRSSSGL